MTQNLTVFYGRNLWMDSPLLLFVLYHINKVLPEGKPIWIEAVLANTGWDHAWTALQETDPAEVHHMLEKEHAMEEVNEPAHECLCEQAAKSVTRNLEKAIQKDVQAQE